MAVDTRNKRFSILAIDNPTIPSLPDPDGTVDSSDRQQFLWKYSGIAFDNPVVVIVTEHRLFRLLGGFPSGIVSEGGGLN